MEERKRLSIVIDHWIEHNESHIAEYQKWAHKSGELGLDQVKNEIEKAIDHLRQCNLNLEKAMKGVEI